MELYKAIPTVIRSQVGSDLFGLLGSSNVAWVTYGVDAGLVDFFKVRHEAHAVSAAAAYARASGRIGIATPTLGPGFANTLNALAAAERDNLPVLVVTGRSPSDKSYGLQNIDQAGLCAALGVGFWDLEQPRDVAELFAAATSAAERFGTPQVVTIDEAFLDSDAGEVVAGPDGDATTDRSHDPARGGAMGSDGSALSDADVRSAVDLLREAERPLILAGWGSVRAGVRDELTQLADLVGARLATTLNAHGLFAGHPRNVGVCGTSSAPPIAEFIAQTDAVLAVGASLNGWTTAGGSLLAGAKVLQCEIDPDAPVRVSSPERALFGDAQAIVPRLLKEAGDLPAKEKDWTTPIPDRGAVREAIRAIDLGSPRGTALDLREVAIALDDILPRRRIIVGDAGRTQHPLPMMIGSPHGSAWINSRGHGSIGLGLGAALGVSVACPDDEVVLLVGDGAFIMSVQELDSFRLNGLHATVVVFNDSQYGSEVKYLNRFAMHKDLIRWEPPDMRGLVESLGGSYLRPGSVADLEELGEPSAGLRVVDVELDPDMDWSQI